MANQGAEKIDYIHGEDVLFEMGTVEGNVGFISPEWTNQTCSKR